MGECRNNARNGLLLSRLIHRYSFLLALSSTLFIHHYSSTGSDHDNGFRYYLAHTTVISYLFLHFRTGITVLVTLNQL